MRLAEVAPDVTAVFVANDSSAIGALEAAFACGWRVPEELSIVGAGGIAHIDMLRVPLTTVSWSRREMGISAARLMIEQIELSPGGPFSRVIVPPDPDRARLVGSSPDRRPVAGSQRLRDVI